MTKTVFEFLGEPVTWAELLGFVTGIACVALAVAQRIETFPIGIANNLFFIVLFVDARLFADAALQVVYIVLGSLYESYIHPLTILSTLPSAGTRAPVRKRVLIISPRRLLSR